MFDSILIANRGEIACRVIATCKSMGIRSIAVFSEADANALHVRQADAALCIGPPPASQSYLSIPAIIAAARSSGAQAIHPGYGFLSENADFADACAAAGITLIGPPAASMRAMGSKAAARARMQAAGVPVVPGYHGDAQDPARFASEADLIGYPVLVKASAGGGGRGMRVVDHPGALPAALQGAAREAAASFGDARLLIEKYLTRPRHIEIQVFADTHGNTVSLFERDCSIQRRHQKVIEEAPAPGLDPNRRHAMGQAAIAAAQAVGYVGAGTVEFIVEGDAFFFMEMNTRLQVEHPVTEMITGQDLVAWQILVADGQPLPLLQHQLGITGHAIEARLYAEDPARDFLPSIGTLLHLRQPQAGPHLRVETGTRQGDQISPYYDAMIAKLVVWGPDRPAALRRLRAGLAAYEVVGVHTNLDLLRRIADTPDFAAAQLDTGFIGRHPALLQDGPATGDPGPAHWAAAALAACDDRRAAIAAPAADPWSPWGAADGWRMNLPGEQCVTLRHATHTHTIRLRATTAGAWAAALPQGEAEIAAEPGPDGETWLRIGSQIHRLRVVRAAGNLVVIEHGANHGFDILDPLAPPPQAAAEGGRLTAPIPARVTRVLVSAGDAVQRGDALLVLEAMKMELTLSAPADGVIEAIRCGVDDMVGEGAELVVFAKLPASG